MSPRSSGRSIASTSTLRLDPSTPVSTRPTPFLIPSQPKTRPVIPYPYRTPNRSAVPCVLADPQHSGRIPNAAAIQGHDLPFHPRQVSLIAVLEQKASLGAD